MFSGRGKIDTTKFYTLLELDQNANAADIKKAYRKLAVKHHPDKGGDADTFKEITRAYEVLSDPEKRRVYDESGEEGLEETSDGTGPNNIFDMFFGNGIGRRGSNKARRQRTKDSIHSLPVTLEQMYTGQVRKMKIMRNVIDNDHGIQTCTECGGQGVKVRVMQRGPMLQQVQSTCRSCGGQGKSFKLRSESQVVEVHVQRGAPNNHRIAFTGMADEYPDADAGDVIFVLKQQAHPQFQRKGADLYIERNIGLVEALCGFSLEVQHLDGRKLLIKTKPGEIIAPYSRGFDPLSHEIGVGWDTYVGKDCPSIRTVAKAETDDINALKTACDSQFKSKGLDVSAFVVKQGRAFFKSGTREEILGSIEDKVGSTMYVVRDLASSSKLRMMKAVKGEGMPTLKEPYSRYGNLFLILNIVFPESLSKESQSALRQHLPPPVNLTWLQDDDEDVELHTVVDIDPLQSFLENKEYVEENSRSEATDDDQGGGHTWSRL